LIFRDRFGRIHDDLRVSVTDRCNLRCAYCMPDEPVWYPRDEILRFEEIVRVVRIAAGAGVRKIRVTGGEPLVRRDLPDLVRLLGRVPGIEDISLTTNGVRLAELALPLREAGLARLNVSLDSLSPERFTRLTRRPVLDAVLRGIAAAARCGLSPIKVNTVVLRGENDDEVETLVEHARENAWELRFIEFMPLANGGTWDLSRVVTGEEIRRRIGARWPLEPDPRGDPHAPAARYLFRDGRGALGFIDSVTRPFCSACSRLRLTADGHFRVCLYDDREIDLKTPLRSGADDAEIAERMRRAVLAKGPGGALEILALRSAPPRSRTMHQIGG
jgi:cyclic pyranopterin phosphate synthase